MGKRFFTTALAIVAGVFAANAQTADAALDKFISSATGSRISFHYSFTAKSATTLKGDGDVVLQDGRWKVNGNGLELYCDGSSTWIVDRQAAEVVIESVEDDMGGGLSGPAMLVASLDDAFVRKDVSRAVLDGNNVVKAVLVPKDDDGLESVTVYLTADGSKLRKAEIRVSDGTFTQFVISSFKVNDKASLKDFSFDEKSLPKNYVVTDLR